MDPAPLAETSLHNPSDATPIHTYTTPPPQLVATCTTSTSAPLSQSASFVLPRLLCYEEIMKQKKRMVQCVFDEATLTLQRMVVDGRIMRLTAAAPVAPTPAPLSSTSSASGAATSPSFHGSAAAAPAVDASAARLRDQGDDLDDALSPSTSVPTAPPLRYPSSSSSDLVSLEPDPDTDTEDGEAYSMEAKQRGVLVYEILETGGFLKLYLKPHARLYWHLQALAGHRAPDWKIHFSVNTADHGRAWDILTRIFIARRCRSGLKIETQGPGSWPEWQRGREMTVYIYRYHQSFEDHMDDTDLRVYREDEQSGAFWLDFAAEVESEFTAAGLRSNGLADGDLSLGGSYASLRNEAFIFRDPAWNLPQGWSGVDIGSWELHGRETTSDRAGGGVGGGVNRFGDRPRLISYVYPPNFAGHNAAGHASPLERDGEGAGPDRDREAEDELESPDDPGRSWSVTLRRAVVLVLCALPILLAHAYLQCRNEGRLGRVEGRL